MKWQDELKKLLQPAQTKDGWGYDIIEADADGFYKILIPFITSLLKQARIDEGKKWYSKMLSFDLQLNTFVVRLDTYYENRIKELSK